MERSAYTRGTRRTRRSRGREGLRAQKDEEGNDFQRESERGKGRRGRSRFMRNGDSARSESPLICASVDAGEKERSRESEGKGTRDVFALVP